MKVLDEHSGESGSWIEWAERKYAGRKKGEWYEIIEREVDNPYKGPTSTKWSERKLTAEEVSQLGLG